MTFTADDLRVAISAYGYDYLRNKTLMSGKYTRKYEPANPGSVKTVDIWYYDSTLAPKTGSSLTDVADRDSDWTGPRTDGLTKKTVTYGNYFDLSVGIGEYDLRELIRPGGEDALSHMLRIEMDNAADKVDAKIIETFLANVKSDNSSTIDVAITVSKADGTVTGTDGAQKILRAIEVTGLKARQIGIGPEGTGTKRIFAVVPEQIWLGIRDYLLDNGIDPAQYRTLMTAGNSYNGREADNYRGTFNGIDVFSTVLIPNTGSGAAERFRIMLGTTDAFFYSTQPPVGVVIPATGPGANQKGPKNQITMRTSHLYEMIDDRQAWEIKVKAVA